MLLRTALLSLAAEGFTALATRDAGESIELPIDSVLSHAHLYGELLDTEMHIDVSAGVGCDERRFLVDGSGRAIFVVTKERP